MLAGGWKPKVWRPDPKARLPNLRLGLPSRQGGFWKLPGGWQPKVWLPKLRVRLPNLKFGLPARQEGSDWKFKIRLLQNTIPRVGSCREFVASKRYALKIRFAACPTQPFARG